MNKINYIIVILLLSIGGSLFSQEDTSWVNGKTIIDVEFEGLKNVDKSELNGIVAPYIGKEFTDELFLELQTIMYELDYFEFIVPNAKPGDDSKETVVLVFQVQESPTISKIIFDGNNEVWNTELFNTIVLKAKDIYSDFKIQRAQKQVTELYQDKGFTNVVVEVGKESDPETNSLIITFNVNEGDQTLIKQIDFHGNNIFATDSKLRSLIDTKKKTLFKDGVYRESIIQSDILRIEGLYHDNGYINAKVLDIKTTIEDDEKKENVKNMFIDIFIEEGDVYTYGGVTYVGNEIYTDADFDKFETLKYGKVYNKTSHERRFVKIQSLYYDNGYIENGFYDEVEIDEESKIISHVITILEKGVAHIGSISVTGNQKTKDIVIEREIKIEPGDVFSRQEVWDSMSNIMSTGVFTNAIPQLNKTDEGNMDLVFEVEEARTINLMGGITVSGEDFEPALTFSLKDTNFMGMNRTFGGTLNLGFETQSFALEYNEPRILNTEFFGGTSLSFTHSQDYLLQSSDKTSGEDDGTTYDGYIYPIIKDDSSVDSYNEYVDWVNDGNDVDEDSGFKIEEYDISLALSGGHLWYTDLGRFKASSGYKGSVSQYIYDDDKYLSFDEDYQDNEGEWTFSDRLWVRGVLDARDTPIGTTEGYGLSQSLTLGGILMPDSNDSDYIKSVSNVDFYFKLLDTPVNEAWDFILSLRLHAAYTTIFEKPGTTLSDDYRTAQIDGMFVGRGWSSEDDGEALLDLKVELNIPIVPNMVGATVFFDAANLWTEYEDKTTFDVDDFKFSFGGALGITNQIMPISFFMAKTFQTEDGSIDWSPESDYNKIFGGNATWGISFNLNYLMQ